MAEGHDFPADDAMRDVANNAAMKDLIETFRNAAVELLGAQAASTLTIASGSVTPTKAVQAIDTEGAAGSDDLANIVQTYLEDGRLLIIYAANSAHTVVVKHNQGGAGELILAGGEDFSLDDVDKYLLLRRDGTVWREIARYFGADASARKMWAAGTTGHLRGLFVKYNTTTSVKISGGAIDVHDGGRIRLLKAASEITKTLTITESTNHVKYLYIDAPASGDALAAADIEQSNTAPAWDDAKQGYYHPTTTDWRFIGSVPVKSDNTIREFKRSADGSRVNYDNVPVVNGTAIPASWGDAGDFSAYMPGIDGARAFLMIRGLYATDYAGNVTIRDNNGKNAVRAVDLYGVITLKQEWVHLEMPMSADCILEWQATTAGSNGYVDIYGYYEPR